MALILDTGPLYAALDRSGADHEACRRLIESAREPLIVPAPVLIEVDYLVHRSLDQSVLALLLEDVVLGAYEVAELRRDDYQRVIELCTDYADIDVGFVDAAVLAIVERLGERKLATLDHRHFTVMRPRHVRNLELLPG